ncbi:MAG: tetratricopeptide repeat protein [Thermodesulfovibrionales bacterium]|nr:tetratricopeptide repeat protein [Thermodesulfovibrionales bacterium]
MADEIEHLRGLSARIDNLYRSGGEAEGKKLLSSALDEAKKIDPAYHLFFQGEWAGYVGKDYEKQKGLFFKAIELRSDDSLLLRNLGVSLSKLSREEEAIIWFDKALEINPKDSDAMYNRGVSLSKLGREEEAIIWFDKALKINPKDSDAMRSRGAVLSKLGRKEEAIIWFDKALEINSKDTLSLAWKAYVFQFLGQYEDALGPAKKACELAPDNANYLSRYNLIARKLSKVVKKKSLPLPDKPRLSAAAKPKETQAQPAAETVNKELLTEVIKAIHKSMSGEKDRLLEEMKKTEDRRNTFLDRRSHIDPNQTLFLVLRKWNSFTPIIPDAGSERHVGGGYLVFNRGQGTVIDPGYNFIENFHQAGFNIHDIHNIVVTHAHNDHTADLESLLTLTYEYNEKIGDSKLHKRLNLYLNTGAMMKYSGFLDLRRAKYLERVHTLMPGHEYALGGGLTLKALSAYHDEIVTKSYAVGLIMTFADDKETRRIVITSDTCLLPQDPETDGIKEDGQEIWQTYPDDGPIDLLVAHLGSIKKQEFENLVDGDGKGKSPGFGKLIYKNHLGIIGTVRVITSLAPKIAVVSEFGEELAPVQEDLFKLVREIVDQFCSDTGKPQIPVLPGDLSFVYRVWERKAYCIFTKGFVPAEQLTYSVVDPDHRKFFYFDRKRDDRILLTKAQTFAHHFENALHNRTPGTIYFAPVFSQKKKKTRKKR